MVEAFHGQIDGFDFDIGVLLKAIGQVMEVQLINFMNVEFDFVKKWANNKLFGSAQFF